MVHRVLLPCAVALAWAATATAAPLDLDAVPAKAVWLMHFDMDAMRGSSVATRAWDRAVKMHPHMEKMAQMGAGMMGMDPRKDLRDVTAYGLDTDKKNGVMIVRAKANRDMLERMVEKAPGHETMMHRSYTLHRWMHKGWKQRGGSGRPVVGAFHKDDVMVFAATPERVKAALDVLDGDSPAVTDGPLAGRVRPGSILVGRAAAIDPGTKCPVLKQGRGYRVAMGERDGTSFYRARLDMQSAEAAEQALDVTKGLAALGSLKFGGDATAMKLVSALKTATSGETCMISWDAPADDVWTVMESAMTSWEKKMRERAAWGRGGSACGKGKCGADCEGCPAGTCPMDKRSGKDGEKWSGKKAEKPLGDDEF
jgi:hypothetical protein